MAYNVGLNLVEGATLNPISGVSTGISAILGMFQKGDLGKATLVTSFADFVSKFGDAPLSGTTSWYSVKGYFAKPGSGTLYVVRCAGAAAAKGTKVLVDRNSSPANTLTVDALSHGAWGNSLTLTVADYNTLSTMVAESTGASAVSAKLVSIGGLEVGSMVKFHESSNTEYRMVEQIDVNNKRIYWTTALTNTYTAAADAKSMEFTLKVYYKGLLVETWDGCGMVNTTSFFVEKLINGKSKYIAVTDMKTVDTDYKDLPAVVATATPCTGGNDGTSNVLGASYVGSQAAKTGLYALDGIVNLFRVMCPNPKLTDVDPVTAYSSLVQSILTYCDTRQTVEYYADVPIGKTVAEAITFAQTFEGKNINFFWPEGIIRENNSNIYLPPSSIMAGVAVDKDYRRGVHKNIGNETVPYFMDLAYHVSVPEGELLNDAGVNTIRTFVGQGLKSYGGRTRSAVTSKRFLSVAEYWNYVAQSLLINLQDIPFEPNDGILWGTAKRRLEAFFANEQLKGAIYDPANPTSNAFLVITDASVNPADQVALGIFTIRIEYVPVSVAEKVVIELTSSPTGLSFTSNS